MYVMRLLGFPRRGFFVDMGAFEAVDYSNSLSLELYYDWDGICVEAGHRQLWSLSHRRCRVVNALLFDGRDAVYDTRRSVGYDSLSGIVSNDTDNKAPAHAADALAMPTVTIARVLRDMGAPRDIDYMSVDLEGAETAAFHGFPFHEYRVKVITVERPAPELRALLESNGFRFVRWVGEGLDVLFAHESLPGLDDLAPRWWNGCGKFCDN